MAEKLALLGGEKAVKIEAGWLLHPEKLVGGKTFEEAFANYVGAKYALAVSSGTAALIAGVMAAGVGPGDEVILPAYTWVACSAAILRNNGIPIFADVDPRTFTLDPEDVKRKITDRTKAILPVDIYGHPANIPELMRIAERNDLIVVEDAAQATGAEINGKRVGGLAHITGFSFSGKPITSTSGGVLTTNSREFFEKAVIAGQHTATISKYVKLPELVKWRTHGLGDNHRIDWKARQVAFQQLLELDLNNNQRIESANYLTRELSKIKGITPPYVAQGYKHIYHLYCCIYDEEYFSVPRETFVGALNAEGVCTITWLSGANWTYLPGGTPIHAGPLHLRTPFQELTYHPKGCPFTCPFYGHTSDLKNNYQEGSLPVTEELCKKEFQFVQGCLNMSRELMEQYVDAIHKVIDNIDDLRKYQGPLPSILYTEDTPRAEFR